MVKSEDIDWDKVEDLGKASDHSVAKRLGAYVSTVSRRRRRLGIPIFQRGIDWSKVSDLGKIYDKEIAKRLGCNVERVRSARIERGIVSCREYRGEKRKEKIEKRIPRSITNARWDNISTLGNMSDEALAKQLGCSPATVGRQRRRRNIPTYGERVHWNTVTDLGQTCDTLIAKRFGVSCSAVSNARRRLSIPSYTYNITCICCGKQYAASRRDTTVCGKRCGNFIRSVCRAFNVQSVKDLTFEIIAAYRNTVEYMKAYAHTGIRKYIDWDNVEMLGVLSDTEVAKIMGCNSKTVRDARTRRGLVGIPRGFRRIANDPDLGKVPDRVIAERLGLSISHITHTRIRLKIPAWKNTRNSSI